MRLIDADALLEEMRTHCSDHGHPHRGDIKCDNGDWNEVMYEIEARVNAANNRIQMGRAEKILQTVLDLLQE